MQYRSSVLVLTSLVAFASCVAELDTSSETSAVKPGGGNGSADPCPTTGCGTNSPYLGPKEFHELEETGATANAEGFRLTGMEKGGIFYVPDVTGTLLQGKNPRAGILEHQDLVGAELIIANDTVGGDGYRIKIMHVSNSQTYWQGPASTVESYELMWRLDKPGPQTYTRVCSNAPDRIDPDGTLWGNVMEAILFTGDRYDRHTLRVTATTPAQAGTWFNIGCAGNVLSKLVLNRHTAASQITPTTLEQRQTMLKMYTSDVCGTGEAFTKQGTALRWDSASGMHNGAPAYATSEAIWNENGVVCLDTHRLHGSADDMTSQIFASCGRIRGCQPTTPPGYLTTHSPAL